MICPRIQAIGQTEAFSFTLEGDKGREVKEMGS